METPNHTAPPVVSTDLFEDRVTFDFDLEARPQPTDDYYARNCKDSIPVTIRATTRVAAEKLALDAIGPCLRGHRWEFRLIRFHSSNACLSHEDGSATPTPQKP